MDEPAMSSSAQRRDAPRGPNPAHGGLNAQDVEFIRENWDIFAWKPSDMPGVPRELAEHTLNIDPKFKPVKQFLRRFNEERCKAIGAEVACLLAAGFIVEVFHPEWLANPVLVLKKNGTWRIVCGLHRFEQSLPS